MRFRHSFRVLSALVLAALPAASSFAAPSRDGITVETIASPIHLSPPTLALGTTPCDGNNYLHDMYFDGASMGGPLVGIDWFPAADAIIGRVEVFTGESPGMNRLAIWSDDGGAPSQPLAALGFTDFFQVDAPNTWYGADLTTLVSVTAGQKYWIVWDPAGGEQCSCTDLVSDTQQTYWGSNDGTVEGGAVWFGPFSFPDRRWKFRVYCDDGGGGGCPDDDEDGICNDEDACPGSVVPEPVIRLGVNRFAMMDEDGTFDTTSPNGNGPRAEFTLESTGGCSCAQIAEALHVGEGHSKYGCSLGIMRRWVELQSP